MSKVSTILHGISKTQSALQALQAISGKKFLSSLDQERVDSTISLVNELLSSLSTRRPSRIISSSSRKMKH